MLLAMDFRRQARVCARLAEEYEDPHLASRLRNMAADLLAKEKKKKKKKKKKKRKILRSSRRPSEGIRRNPKDRLTGGGKRRCFHSQPRQPTERPQQHGKNVER